MVISKTLYARAYCPYQYPLVPQHQLLTESEACSMPHGQPHVKTGVRFGCRCAISRDWCPSGRLCNPTVLGGMTQAPHSMRLRR
ncbi:hypothetical protein K458DRAFT_416119 [Lentithecium fluviatile CBS 122367]|uniref:Uncharacterized protein n=1 Tax=Lentithecium fluviatile CBS 122367 TaxID=1168545 RepID=A0A6G1J9F8_9PLEO|nr:hypothetical protein K458DRAFT_416119 [Lentithecium fluviatile CBS 122367]